MIIPIGVALFIGGWGLPPHMIPPARYARPYKGELVTVYANDDQFLAVCGTLNASGCTRGAYNGRCVILVRRNLRRAWFAPYVIRHEIAHCNGWPGHYDLAYTAR
jgi:hypothetical protein